MHGAALALAHAGLTGQDFRHHIVDADALADGLTVAAVGAEYVVLRLQGGDGSGRGGLLADAQMGGAVNQSLGEQPLDVLLKIAGQIHVLPHF